MNKRWTIMAALMAGGLLSAGTAVAEERPFPLAAYVPSDVLLYVGERHNPERQFVSEYWDEVLEALGSAGIGNDVLEICSLFMGEDAAGNVQRLRTRAEQVLDGVAWDQLVGQEMAFAERLSMPRRFAEGGIYFGPPEMVWLFQLPDGAAEANYDGLVAILDAIAEEINRAAHTSSLKVVRRQSGAATTARVDLLAALPGAPSLPLAVLRHGNILGVAVNDGLIGDVVKLLEGQGPESALSRASRFRGALQELPPAEGMMTFFSMPAMLRPFHDLTDLVAETVSGPKDVYLNTGLSGKASRLHGESLAAYRAGDYPKALALTEQAYELAPNSSLVVYNLACFSALTGQRQAALQWLERAVEQGFHAPNKIAADDDLVSLRDDPRYQQALANAKRLARAGHVEDIIINSSKSDAAYSLTMQAWQAAERRQYDHALSLAEQAYEMSPDDSRVLYALACFHALRGQEQRGLHFLEKAAEGGFYCPGHIANDNDLKALRNSDRFSEIVSLARSNAAAMTTSRSDDKLDLVTGIMKGTISAFEVIDCAATVQSTTGYSVHTHSRVSLVPDAASHPIYAALASRPPLAQFDRYLPVETESFQVTSGFDFGVMYQYMLDVLQQSGAGGQEVLAEWNSVQERVGFNLATDVLQWVDGAFTVVTLKDGQGDVLLLKVTDEAEARKQMTRGLDHLVEMLGEAVREVPALAMVGMRRSPTEHPELPGFENLHVAMSPVPVVWGVADSHAIVGTSADAIALCLRTARGEHPSVRQNERVMAEAIVPDGKFYTVALTDERQLGEEMAGMLQMVTMFVGPMTMAIPDEASRMAVMKVSGILGKLVPVAARIDFYKSTARASTFDGQSWRMHQVQHYKSPAERAAE